MPNDEGISQNKPEHQPAVDYSARQTRAISWKQGGGPMLLSAVAASLLCYFYSPGLMSVDSISQYKQSVGLQPINDYFPVIMVRLWRLLYPIAGVSSILVFDQVVYWGGICILSLVLFRSVWKRMISIVITGLWPPLLIISLHVWKDAGMLCAFMLAGAAIVANERRPTALWSVLAVLALLYGTAVRYNAVTGAVPLIAYLTWQVIRSRVRHTKLARKVAFSFMPVIVFVVVELGVIRIVDIGAVHINPWSNIVTWDIAALSIKKNDDYVPKYMTKGQSPQELLDEMRHAFDPVANIPVFSVIKGQPPAGKSYDLLERWLSVIVHNPCVYLHHRWTVFSRLLDTSGSVYYPFNPGISSNNLGLALWNMPKSVKWRALFRALASTVAYRPWIYLIGALTIFVAAVSRAVRNKKKMCGKTGLMIAFSASALGIMLPLFVVAPAADFRYTIWMIGAVVVCCIVMLSNAEGLDGKTFAVTVNRDGGAS